MQKELMRTIEDYIAKDPTKRTKEVINLGELKQVMEEELSVFTDIKILRQRIIEKINGAMRSRYNKYFKPFYKDSLKNFSLETIVIKEVIINNEKETEVSLGMYTKNNPAVFNVGFNTAKDGIFCNSSSIDDKVFTSAVLKTCGPEIEQLLKLIKDNLYLIKFNDGKLNFSIDLADDTFDVNLTYNNYEVKSLIRFKKEIDPEELAAREHIINGKHYPSVNSIIDKTSDDILYGIDIDTAKLPSVLKASITLYDRRRRFEQGMCN